ncbi:protein-tyrosine phosphatase-like protein [Astrocystis sublimbata]|nr:protein-tyrosine phosphatase-like protein [Astrocystis sublimbata]
MDHLTARFRRSRKATPHPVSLTTTIPPTVTAIPTDHHHHSPASPTPADPKTALPSLSINTTPATTPPGSSHTNTSHSLMPKSPLRSFNQFRAAHKRARSPAPLLTQLPSTTTTTTTHPDYPQDHPPTPSERAMSQLPPFLRLSDESVDAKFQELQWLERMRNQQSIQNPSPTFQFARVLSPETKILDRYANIQPWANNRVRLTVPDGKLDYINASPIASPSPTRPDTRPVFRYIAMQGPKSNTVEHTWRMIAELKNPVVIVMLTDTHEGHMEKCFPYFPREPRTDGIDVGEADEFEDGFRARVTCISNEERQDGAIQMRRLNLHVHGQDTTVWHLLYRKWPDFGVPRVEDHDSFFELMKLSRELNTKTDNPRIIHCSAGVGRTGTFITLETLMRDVDEGAMDNLDQEMKEYNDDLVFRTVNYLREQRRTMVQADSQYAFIYTVLRRHWMERHGLLENASEKGPASKRLEVSHDPFVEHTH